MHIDFIQDIIDILRSKHKLKTETTELLQVMFNKIETLKNLSNIKTLILGSSHGEYGFICTNPTEYNLAISYQDLYYSYNLYKKFNNKDLKNIVIFYSVFSPGYQLIKTNDYCICCQYKFLANIDYQSPEILNDLNIEKIEKNTIKHIKWLRKHYEIKNSDRGNCKNYVFPCKTDNVQERTVPHYKNNQRHNNQNKYLKLLIEKANKNNQKVIIIISPATQTYKKVLPNSEHLFRELFDLISINNYSNVDILNLYDREFSQDLFGDWDHLNKLGAEKISKMIEELL